MGSRTLIRCCLLEKYLGLGTARARSPRYCCTNKLNEGRTGRGTYMRVKEERCQAKHASPTCLLVIRYHYLIQEYKVIKYDFTEAVSSRLSLEAPVRLQLRLQDAAALGQPRDVRKRTLYRLRYLDVPRHRVSQLIARELRHVCRGEFSSRLGREQR